MNNKLVTFAAIALDIILLSIAIFTGAWSLDQARLLLSMGIAFSTIVSATGLVRWIKYGSKSNTVKV